MNIAFGVLLLTSALALPAHADLSDSGSLSIGGQAVVEGTMTVSGDSFSVGGDTFSVAGGSVTLGGVLNAAAAGIKWADGSVSTTAASGGGGNAVLDATQTFSGANAFTSTLTVGPSVVSATVTFASALKGNWSLIASTHPAAQSAVYFYGLISTSPYGSGSVRYRVEYDLTQNGSVGALEAQFNGDAATGHYVWSTWGEAEPSGGSLSNTGGRDTKCYLSYVQGEVAGDSLAGTFWFQPQIGNDTRIRGHGIMDGFFNTGDYYGMGYHCGLIAGTTPLSSLKIFTTAGTFTGDVSIFALLVP